MARCEQGYLCEVCGSEVEALTDSDLYLRYVLGEVAPAHLHLAPVERLPIPRVVGRSSGTRGVFAVAAGVDRH